MKNARDIGADDKRLVVRRNELMLSSYNLSLQESRLFYWILSLIDQKDKDFKTYDVNVKELFEIIGTETGNTYMTIKDAVTRLGGRSAIIREPDQDRVKQVWFFSSVEYRFGEGCVRIKLNDEMKPYLLNLKEKFAKVPLAHVLKMKSFYAQRIYDYIKVNEFKGGAIEVTVEELRKVCSIAKGVLTRGNDLKRYVLDIAKREINDHTDITLDYEVERVGRSIGLVRFLLKHEDGGHGGESAARTNHGSTQDAMAPYIMLLTRHGMDRSEAHTICREWGARDGHRITWHVQELEKITKEKPGAIKAPAGWLRTAIKSDYRPTHLKHTVHQRSIDDQQTTTNTRSVGDILRQHKRTNE